MASGDPVLQVIQAFPPATAMATQDTRAGGSTPAESYSVFDFDASTDEYMDFLVRLSEKYAGGGLTVTIPWIADSATANNVQWGVAFRRINDESEDVDTSQTYDENLVTSAAPGTNGQVQYATVTFTNGADMDSLAAGEFAIMRVHRDADDATNDTMTGDACLLTPFGKET